MRRAFDAYRTQAAWRDFAIGVGLLVLALRGFQTGLMVRAPAASVAVQALVLAAAIVAHVVLYNSGKLTEVTATVASFGRVSALRLLLVCVAGSIVMLCVWRMAELIGGPIDQPVPGGAQLFDRSITPPVGFLALAFYLVITAPIIEELSFRGWMQQGLALGFKPAIAIATPAVLFAVLHAGLYSHPGYLLIPLALGMILGLVARRAGALWPSIVLHSLWNVVMLGIAARNAKALPRSNAPHGAVEAVLLLVGIGIGSVGLLRVLSGPRPLPGEARSAAALDAKEAA